METQKLYYTNSFMREFEAKVLSSRAVDNRYHTVLDRTAFYPTGGGQPHDVGWLDEIEVIDVLEREDGGEIIHVTKEPIRKAQVHGTIDWNRRRDHMQQHTGQHILSAAFVQVCAAPTVGFHMGVENSTIDLKTGLSIPDSLGEVVRLANGIVFEDREVQVLNVRREEAESMRLRKESAREGILRIIEVSGFDRTPCGGTHVTRTGQIGLILTRKVERYKQGWRVEFVCGERALKYAAGDYAILGTISKLLSSPFEQIPALVEKQIEESKSARKERTKLLRELAALRANDFLSQAAPHGNLRVLCRAFQDEEIEFVKLLAEQAIMEPRVVALFAVTTIKPQVVFAASSDSGVDAGRLFKACAGEFPLKGGGAKNLAQGSMDDASAVAALLEFAERQLRAG